MQNDCQRFKIKVRKFLFNIYGVSELLRKSQREGDWVTVYIGERHRGVLSAEVLPLKIKHQMNAIPAEFLTLLL